MATQSDTSRVQVSFLDELYTSAGAARSGPAGAWGTVPAAALSVLSVTGESLKAEKKTVRSNIIRSDRQQPPSVVVGKNALGDTDHELFFGYEWTPFLSAALLADGIASTHGWYNPTTGTTNGGTATGSSNVTFATPANTITFSSGSPALSTKFVVGQWVQVKGTTNNGTNSVPKYFRITAVNSATQITVATTAQGGTDLIAESNTSAVLCGAMIRNGVLERSFDLQRQATDQSSAYWYYSGCEIDKFTLDVVAEQIIKGKFSWLGKQGFGSAAAIGSGGPVAAPTNPDIMNATSNVGTIQQGGLTLATGIKEIHLTIANALRKRAAVGAVAGVGVSKGSLMVTGTAMVYFEGLTQYTLFENHTLTSLSFHTTDSAGNKYIWTLPAVRWITDDVPTPGKDQDFMENISWEAEIDSTTNCMIQIDRFAA